MSDPDRPLPRDPGRPVHQTAPRSPICDNPDHGIPLATRPGVVDAAFRQTLLIVAIVVGIVAYGALGILLGRQIGREEHQPPPRVYIVPEGKILNTTTTVP